MPEVVHVATVTAAALAASHPGDDDPLLIKANRCREAFAKVFDHESTGAERVVRRALGEARSRVVSLHETVAELEAKLNRARADLAAAREELEVCIHLVPDQPSTN